MDSKKIFRDPIYGLIIFDKNDDEVITKIIDLPEFQRLRRIRQLGLSFYTYSSSVHDRFSHSIGVCYLAGVLVEKLIRPDEKTKIYARNQEYELGKKEFKLLIQLAALLHDIGHGPFSHAFERITKVNHEKLTKLIIKSPSVKAVLESGISNEVLRKNACDWIIGILDKKLEPLWVRELISSQLDVDRMDYLLRDAYMCGVEYSKFDWQWIFENMSIQEFENKEGKKSQRLVINAKRGIFSLESFIVSRYHMYEQVYYHKTTRGFEGILKKIFYRVEILVSKKSLRKSHFIEPFLYDFIVERSENREELENLSLQSYLSLDDFLLMSQFKLWSSNCKDRILKELCICFCLRTPFKKVHEGTRALNNPTIDQIRNKIKNNFDYYFFEDTPETSLYNVLYTSNGGEEGEHIWLVDGDNKLLELSANEGLVKSMANIKITKERAYCHPECYHDIMEIINSSKKSK